MAEWAAEIKSAKSWDRRPDEAERNPGLRPPKGEDGLSIFKSYGPQAGAASPDCAALHPGYAEVAHATA
jgi:hypothetical protein